MCPKVHSSLCVQQDSVMKETHLNRKMSSTTWSIHQEDKHDSGLESINLHSLRMHETDNVSTIEHALLNMKIDSVPQTWHHDSGVYTSGQYTSHRGSENDKIDTLCDVDCIEEDVNVHRSECNETNHSSRTDGRIQFHVRAEQVCWLFEGDKDGDNRLHLSIINGQEACSRLIINLAQEYDCLSFSNLLRQTPLHLAVLTRQPHIVRRLICAGATVLAQDKHGDTPLHIACRQGYTEIVQHLLTPVHYEETLQNTYTIPFQRVPQDLRVRNYEGQTCLHVAASSGHHNVVQMLLDAGADINMGDGKSGRTVLHLAVDMGDTELVELLLSYTGINVKKQDYAGLTPIQLGFGRNRMNIVKIICCLSGAYDGIHLSDPEISIDDEDLSDDSDTSDCCHRFSTRR